MSSAFALQAYSEECFEAILNFLPFPALAQLIAVRHDTEWQRSLDDRLQLRRLRGYSVQKIAPGGAIHLRPKTLESWFNMFGFVFSDSRDVGVECMDEIRQRLKECIWWVDLIACGNGGWNGPDEKNRLHGGCVDRASCPHCRSLWSGTTPANLWVENGEENEDESAERCLFNSESNEPQIRLSLNVHIREPTTTHWQHKLEEFEDSSYAYELRLFCISRRSWQVLWYADTRRAYYEYSSRFFVSKKWGRAIEVDMDATLDADGLGCKFKHVDITGIRKVCKGVHGW